MTYPARPAKVFQSSFSGVASLLVFLIVTLSGCARTIALRDIGDPQTSGIRTNLPYDGRGGIRATYRPGPADVLILRFHSPNAFAPAPGACLHHGGTRLDIVSADLTMSNEMSGLEILHRPVEALRLPLGILPEGGASIRVTTRSGLAQLRNQQQAQQQQQLPTTDATLNLPGPGNSSWGDYLDRLGDTCLTNHMTVELMPVDATPVSPGDQLVLTRQSFITDRFATGGGSGTRRRTAERFELEVAEDGTITLPPLTRVSRFGMYGSGGEGPIASRFELQSALSAVETRVPVAGRSLGEVASCLSMAPALPLPDYRHCEGIDSRFGPVLEAVDGNALAEVIYILEPGPRTWFLVDERGRRIEIPYRYGTSIADATEQHYRRWLGRELVRSFRKSVILTVVPAVGSSEPGFAARLRLRSGESALLRNVMLLPGDTVHVTQPPSSTQPDLRE